MTVQSEPNFDPRVGVSYEQGLRGKKLLILAGRGIKGGGIQVWYVLVPSVTLPPRLHFGETFQESLTRVKLELNYRIPLGY